MEAMTGVSGILGRINDITARFGGERGGPFVVVETAEFDPFGATYKAAVAAVAPAVPTPAATYAQSYGPVVPGVGRSGGTVAPPTPQQVQAGIDGVAGAPGQRPIGGYGRIPVPAELAAYGNGRIPREALTPIGQGGHRLYAPAAASWQNVVAAARADGIELVITDSYRSYDQQVDLADRKGLYKNGGLAAVPGTSTHGWGMAVDADIRNPATLEWLRVNGPRFGWVETTPREPWHWEFRPNQV